MPLTDILLPLGRVVVTAAVQRWVANRREIADRTLPLAELINRQVTDGLERRTVDRAMEHMVDSVVIRLRPLVAGRYPDLPPWALGAARSLRGAA